MKSILWALCAPLFSLLSGVSTAQGLLQPEADTGYEAKQAVVAHRFMVVAAPSTV